MVERSLMKNMKFLKKVVTFSISFIVFYTLLEITLSYFIQVELSPTLTSCVYTFFGTELVSTAVIKIIEEILSAKQKRYEQLSVDRFEKENADEDILESQLSDETENTNLDIQQY